MPATTVTSERSVRDILGELGLPDGASYLDMIRRMSRQPCDDVAVEFDEEVVSYGRLLSMVAGAVAYLEARGVRRGDHVAFMCQPHPDSLAACLGILGMGAVLVPIYHELRVRCCLACSTAST